MKKIILLLITVGISSVSGAALSTLNTSGGQIKFTAVGKPGFLKIKGESKGSSPNGQIKIENNQATGKFSFDLKSLNTGIDLRDEHMKDKYLEVAKFPETTLTLNPLPVTEAELKSNFKKSFKGKLDLHGQQKDIDGQFQYNAETKKVTATFTIKVSDYNIDIPKHMGITVSETVDVEVELTLK